MNALANNPTDRRAAARVRTGFTLAEMLVAIALVALLTVGIGQVFSNISRLVGTGAAVAEVDTQARAIEKQLRDDFRSASRLAMGEQFVVIRNARSQSPVYTNREDREIDLRRGLTPGDDRSNARYRRIDEIAFLSFAGETGAFTSYQHDGGTGGADVRALYARIYYGHGLKPAPDLEFDPDDDRVPIPYRVPDGDFGQTPGESNDLDPVNIANGGRVSAWARNEFAGDWIMVRQPLLLYGGLAAGSDTRDEAIIGNQREFAPYIRDTENQQRFGNAGGFANIIGDGYPNGGIESESDNPPRPRLIRHGRVDICAQTIDTALRWLEGREESMGAQQVADATAFDNGLLDQPDDDLDDNNAVDPDSPLYVRTVETDPRQTEARNRSRILSAFAGVMQRVLCDNTPPVIDRGGAGSVSNPEDALMDLHASFAMNCSNLEIAWSDGTTWAEDDPLVIDIDYDDDGTDDATVTYDRGDIVWFDIDYPRRDLVAENPFLYRAADDMLDAEIVRDRRDVRLYTGNDPDNSAFVGYDWFLAGGREEPDDEYMAVWPTRRPNNSGGYAGAWTKPQLIRFRITLNDSLGRIPGGKTFEFIVALNPVTSG